MAGGETAIERETGNETPGWLVSMIGSRQHYAVPRVFARTGGLRHFYTDAWYGRGRETLRRLGAAGRSMAGRYHPELAGVSITAFNLGDLAWRFRKAQRRTGADRTSLYRFYHDFGRWYASAVRDRVLRLGPDPKRHAFFGFNTGSLETVEALRGRGVFTVVDQIDPARTEERVIAEEVERWPGWESAPGRVPDSFFERLDREWAAADRVLVNSAWSADALVEQGVDRRKVLTVPLAYEPTAVAAPPARPRPDGPLRVLWLGTVNLRKGIPYLIEAARRVAPSDAVFDIVGPLKISERAVADAPSHVTFHGRATRDRADGFYRAADVFVLPTLSDGFAITQLEAMAHGLPVITTPRCGDVVRDGTDGRRVEAGSVDALVEAIEWFLNRRPQLPELSEQARARSRDFSLDAYGQRLDAELKRTAKHTTN
ncbi:MAG: glycosyltransferase family 4 protein [Planctomycetota bacterium]